MIIQNKISQETANLINRGGIGVIATDTIYGVIASAFNQNSIERIYKIRRRDLEKPMIILISSLCDLERFEISLSVEEKEKIGNLWPGPISIVFKNDNDKFAYLHRGRNSLSFRWPKSLGLERLIRETGPLVAPSANLAGHNPSETIQDALGYFQDKVDFYIDSGRVCGKPSTLIKWNKGDVELIRPGAFDYDEIVRKI